MTMTIQITDIFKAIIFLNLTDDPHCTSIFKSFYAQTRPKINLLSELYYSHIQCSVKNLSDCTEYITTI